MEKHLRFNHFTGKRLHLGVCGSVAAFRVAELVHRWQEAGVSLSATLTPAARKFIGKPGYLRFIGKWAEKRDNPCATHIQIPFYIITKEHAPFFLLILRQKGNTLPHLLT